MDQSQPQDLLKWPIRKNYAGPAPPWPGTQLLKNATFQCIFVVGERPKIIFFKLFLNHIIEKQPFCKLWPYMTTIGRLAHTSKTAPCGSTMDKRLTLP